MTNIFIGGMGAGMELQLKRSNENSKEGVIDFEKWSVVKISKIKLGWKWIKGISIKRKYAKGNRNWESNKYKLLYIIYNRRGDIVQLKIISMIKIDGEWVKQEDIPHEKFQEILTKVMTRAGNAIGAKVQKTV